MDYSQIANQIESLKGVRKIGRVGNSAEQYDLYQIKRGKGKKVLLTGVVHGDEPAGVYAIIDFFQNHIHEFEKDFEFTAFPCVNPWGFQHFTRGNAFNLNLNREFKQDASAEETRLIMPLLEEYVFAMDLHETWPESTRIEDDEPKGADPNEFYLWEICENTAIRVGSKIVKNIEEIGLPVCKWSRIYGDKNNGGVIWYPEDCGTNCYATGTSFDSYLAANHTKQAFTIETPRDWPLKKRVLAHVISIKTALQERR
jgi:hypothetical protein